MDLPVNTHNYIVEQVSGGNNAKKMMWSRYIKFVKSLVKNKKPCISSLFKIIQSDIRSVTASNLKTILLETDKLIIPGTTNKLTLKEYNVYQTPQGEEWRAPLITSLLQIKEDQWVIEFDQEGEEFLPNDVIKIMIDSICVD